MEWGRRCMTHCAAQTRSEFREPVLRFFVLFLVVCPSWPAAPFSPSLTSLTVSVDVKHHVYLLLLCHSLVDTIAWQPVHRSYHAAIVKGDHSLPLCHEMSTAELRSFCTVTPMSRFGSEARRKLRHWFDSALVSFSLQKLLAVNSLVTLSLTINETLKWLSLLPILMQESFWWWQCSDQIRSIRQIICRAAVRIATPIQNFFLSNYAIISNCSLLRFAVLFHCSLTYFVFFLFHLIGYAA